MRPRPIPPAVRSFQCPSCGYPLEVRAPGQAKVIACRACTSILDAQHPQFKVLEEYKEKARPLTIPLGQRGTLDGVEWEMVGSMLKKVANNPAYAWWENLLWNPHHGYRWLVESDGHWVLLAPCLGRPVTSPARGKPGARFDGRDFKGFQQGKAKVAYVIGEFPWRVRRGGLANTIDYIDPPFQLSREKTKSEEVWTVGRYIPHHEVEAAFAFEQSLDPIGVAPAQPSPWEPMRKAMHRLFSVFLATAVVLQIVGLVMARNDKVLEYQGTWRQGEDPVQVTDLFELEGRKSNVRIKTRANVDNGWAYFMYALINEDTGQALNLGREISYYHGRSGGESWKEGKQHDKVFVPGVESGRWFLRLELQTNEEAVDYSIEMRRDAPRWAFFIWTLIFILVPYGIFAIARASFEAQRWQNSDIGR